MIRSRVGDGRDDTSIEYDKPERPGFWQPLEGGSMLAPWLGSVDPLVLDGVVPVDGPDRLASDAYARDYDQALRLGPMNSVERTLVADGHRAVLQLQLRDHGGRGPRRPAGGRTHEAAADGSPLRRHARRHGRLDHPVLGAEARRRVLASRPGDRRREPRRQPRTPSPRTKPWVPLITNPPYSDYVSGHASLTAPAVQTLRMMMGEDTHLTLHSYSHRGGPRVRQPGAHRAAGLPSPDLGRAALPGRHAGRVRDGARDRAAGARPPCADPV